MHDGGWQFATGMGVAEDEETKQYPHAINMLDLGKHFNVPLSKKAIYILPERKLGLGVGVYISP